MDYGTLKDNLDFYEKIINVTSVNDKITNELNGAIGHLYSLTTFNMRLTDFDSRNKLVILKVDNEQIQITNIYNVIFRLTYLRYLIENFAKKNKGLRIIYDYLECTNCSVDDLNSELCDYVKARKEYVSDSDENIQYLKQYVYALQIRLNNIQALLEELE